MRRSSRRHRGRTLLVTAAVTTVMLASGGVGTLDNEFSQTYRQVLDENLPQEIIDPVNDFFGALGAPTIGPTVTPTLRPTETPAPTLTPIPSVTPTPFPTPTSSMAMANLPFPFQRPIPDGFRNIIDPTDRYGKIQDLEVTQHGADFVVSLGTPVLAAAPGIVLVANVDGFPGFGPGEEFYGNLVIIEHHFANMDVNLYTLYAHLDTIDTVQGREVEAGEQIGTVGQTGNTAGSELHFEVRYAINRYLAVSNPDLWLEPLRGEEGTQYGALAGIIVDAGGDMIEVDTLAVAPLGETSFPTKFIRTYEDPQLWRLPPYNETFAIGDLEPGEYELTIFLLNGRETITVEIKPNEVTFVEWMIEE